jgi:hypothetical protein
MAVVELDDLLEEATLRGVKVQFWKRHKMKYPAEMMPADTLVSRCYRELDRRLLTVYNVWTVKNLLFQVTSTRKRKKLAPDLYMYEDAHEVPHAQSPDKYLALLHTYLLSLAIAGVGKVPGAPVEPEGFGADPTKYVVAPWDTLEAYYFRAVRAAQDVPEARRADWLERMDVAERAVWVSQFREGSQSIGQVIQDVYTKRDAHWEVSPVVQESATSGGNAHASPYEAGNAQRPGPKKGQPPPPPPPRGQQQGAANKLPPGTVAKALRDGKELCPDFQKGVCKIKKMSCTKGLHKCARVNARGRVCGMPFHGAKDCRQK